MGYDQCLRNPDKSIGGFFARLKENGLIMEVAWTRSRIPSNHIRRIRVYEWTQKASDLMG